MTCHMHIEQKLTISPNWNFEGAYKVIRYYSKVAPSAVGYLQIKLRKKALDPALVPKATKTNANAF